MTSADIVKVSAALTRSALPSAVQPVGVIVDPHLDGPAANAYRALLPAVENWSLLTGTQAKP